MNVKRYFTLVCLLSFLLLSEAIAQHQSGRGEIWFESYHSAGFNVNITAIGNYRWNYDLERTSSHTGTSEFSVPSGGTSTRMSVSAVWDDCELDTPCKIAADIYKINFGGGSFYIDLRTTEVMSELIPDIIIYKDASGDYRWDNTGNATYDDEKITFNETYAYWDLLTDIDFVASGFDQSLSTPANFTMGSHSVGGGVCGAKAILG